MITCTEKTSVSCNFVRTHGNYVQITEMHIYEILTLHTSVRDQAVTVEYGNSDLGHSSL